MAENLIQGFRVEGKKIRVIFTNGWALQTAVDAIIKRYGKKMMAEEIKNTDMNDLSIPFSRANCAKIIPFLQP